MRSHKKVFISVGAVLALGMGLASTAGAQEAPYLEQPLRAPSQAFELRLGTGYTQGFGNVAPGRTLPDVSGAGIAGDLSLDARTSPNFSFGIDGQYQEFTSQQNTASRGLAGTIGGTVHFAPYAKGDPWARLGTGYRMLWEVDPSAGPAATNNGSVLRHGFDLASLKLGYDVRVSEDVAIAPIIAGDVNMFLWEVPSGGTNHALSSAQIGSFVYGGLLGRFDIGGQRTVPAATTTTTTTEMGMAGR
jgi:hypothetical protein